MNADAAVITAAAAVVVAVANQLFTVLRSRSDRSYERRRTALLDVQDAALQLRRELGTYGRGLDAQVRRALPATVDDPADDGARTWEVPDAPSSDPVDQANGLLDVRAVRLDARCHAVSAALVSWREAASDHFLSPLSETRGTEQDRWVAFNAAVSAVLDA